MKKVFFLTIALLMGTIAAMAQPKPGLYKQTKYQSADGQEMETTNDTYLMIKDGKTYEIQTYHQEGVRRAYVVEKEMRGLLSVADAIVYSWMYNPTGYPGAQNEVRISNVYMPAEKIMSEEMKEFLDVMERVGQKGVKKNKLLGVWHEADESSTLYYKYYDKKVRMTARLAKVGNNTSIVFTMEDVKYTKDGNTIEGGNPCTIKWNGTDNHDLIYVYNGYTNTEKWARTAMPDEVVDIFR